jgi:hypothetical protein
VPQGRAIRGLLECTGKTRKGIGIAQMGIMISTAFEIPSASSASSPHCTIMSGASATLPMVQVSTAIIDGADAADANAPFSLV